MRTIAYIDPTTGFISSYSKTTMDTAPYDGTTVNGVLVKDVTDIEFAGKYWNGNTFLDLPAQPDIYHNWAGSQWVFDSEKAIEEARRLRDRYLNSSDWTQVSDAPLTPEQVASWKTYRQALRDLPDSWTSLTCWDDIIWPTKPA